MEDIDGSSQVSESRVFHIVIDMLLKRMNVVVKCNHTRAIVTVDSIACASGVLYECM